MLYHVAVFKWRPGFPDHRRQEWTRRLQALPDQIGPLRSIAIGSDKLHGNRSWDTAVVAILDDVDALAEYTQHPEHQQIIKISAPHIDQLAQVDFES